MFAWSRENGYSIKVSSTSYVKNGYKIYVHTKNDKVENIYILFKLVSKNELYSFVSSCLKKIVHSYPYWAKKIVLAIWLVV